MKTVTISKIIQGEVDQEVLAKAKQKWIKQMERQNAKILVNPGKFRGFQICDPIEYADDMAAMYAHTFRKTAKVAV